MRVSVLIGAIFSVCAQSICDKYTVALLKENTAENQMTLLTLVVNTAIIGNYTQPNVLPVSGILAPGEFNGEKVNLLRHFTGELPSANVDEVPSKVNFLDGGAAEPLKQNMPAFNMSSNQYKLVTHLYSFFGTLLGCSMQSDGGAFDIYRGDISMYETHKFMGLTSNEIGYFNQQVGLSAMSFGVSDADATVVFNSLQTLFNGKCGTKASIGENPEAVQSLNICVASTPNTTTTATTTTEMPTRSNAIKVGFRLAFIVMCLAFL